MGKTADGAVWLNAEMRSPYEFWQFWRNTADADVGRFLKLYTELPVAECERLGALDGAEINEAKITLANAVTTLAHGAEAAAAAEATAREVFEKGGTGEELPTLVLKRSDFSDEIALRSAPPDTIAKVCRDDPSQLSDEKIHRILARDLFLRAKLVKSGKEAKRLFAEGGARINDEVVTDISLQLSIDKFSNPIKISAGKKRHALVTLAE